MTLLINYLKSVIEPFRSGQGSDCCLVTTNGSKLGPAHQCQNIFRTTIQTTIIPSKTPHALVCP